MDSLITDKIDNEIQDVDGIDKITSTSGVGVSSIVVQLRNETNTRDALTDIKDKVDKVTIPTDANDPIVQDISMPNELLFQALLYAPQEDFDNYKLMQLAREMENDLEGKSGIESIDVGGTSADHLSASSTASEYDIKVLISKAKVENL